MINVRIIKQDFKKYDKYERGPQSKMVSNSHKNYNFKPLIDSVIEKNIKEAIKIAEEGLKNGIKLKIRIQPELGSVSTINESNTGNMANVLKN